MLEVKWAQFFQVRSVSLQDNLQLPIGPLVTGHNVNCTCLRAVGNQEWGQITFHTTVVSCTDKAYENIVLKLSILL